jgi:hypothetical protein
MGCAKAAQRMSQLDGHFLIGHTRQPLAAIHAVTLDAHTHLLIAGQRGGQHNRHMARLTQPQLGTLFSAARLAAALAAEDQFMHAQILSV